jgi:hypothetical protein
MLDGNTKAVVIEVMDVFLEMGVEEIPEDYPDDKELEAHVKVINDVLAKAKDEGYRKYVLLNREEAEAKGQNLGINGMYLVILRK